MGPYNIMENCIFALLCFIATIFKSDFHYSASRGISRGQVLRITATKNHVFMVIHSWRCHKPFGTFMFDVGFAEVSQQIQGNTKTVSINSTLGNLRI